MQLWWVQSRFHYIYLATLSIVDCNELFIFACSGGFSCTINTYLWSDDGLDVRHQILMMQVCQWMNQWFSVSLVGRHGVPANKVISNVLSCVCLVFECKQLKLHEQMLLRRLMVVSVRYVHRVAFSFLASWWVTWKYLPVFIPLWEVHGLHRGGAIFFVHLVPDGLPFILNTKKKMELNMN